MIIEFLGNPGAGKTTLIPILTQLLRDEGLTAMSVTEAIHHYMRKTHLGRLTCFLMPRALQGPILWRVFSYFVSGLYAARFAIKRPQLVRYVFQLHLCRQIPWRHRWLILRLFLKLMGRYHFLKSQAQSGEALVFDEGFVHRIVHMFVSETERPNPQLIVEYLELLPRSDMVILVQTPLDLCLSRIRARGLQVRLHNRGAQEIAQFMSNAEQVVNIASQYLKHTGWEIIEIQNDRDPAMSTAALRHNLSRYSQHLMADQVALESQTSKLVNGQLENTRVRRL